MRARLISATAAFALALTGIVGAASSATASDDYNYNVQFISDEPATEGTVGELFEYPFYAEGCEVGSYELLGVIPSGLTFYSNGLLTGIPVVGDHDRSYTYRIQANCDNGEGHAVTGNLNLYINEAPDTTAPQVTLAENITVRSGSIYVATGSANEWVKWEITGGTHSHLFNVGKNSGVLSFKKQAVQGVYTVIVTATDASGNSTSITVTVTVPDSTFPIIHADDEVTVFEGETELLTPEATEEVVWAIEDTLDGELFVIDEHGDLAFTSAEVSLYGDYEVRISATDLANNKAYKNVIVHVKYLPLGLPTNIKTHLNDDGTTTVTWDPAPNALEYTMTTEYGRSCTTAETTCTVKGIAGPKTFIKVKAFGKYEQKTYATAQAGSYTKDKNIYIRSVYRFAESSEVVNAKEYLKIRKLTGYLKDHGLTRIILVGYTDNQGGAAGAETLSIKRAKALAKKLRAQTTGVTIRVVAGGISKFVAPNDNEWGRSKNRRVEIFIA